MTELVRRESPIKALADMFAALANIFADPVIQETGDQFFRALSKTIDRELPGVRISGQLTTGQPAERDTDGD